jgi:hypothetical protein
MLMRGRLRVEDNGHRSSIPCQASAADMAIAWNDDRR